MNEEGQTPWCGCYALYWGRGDRTTGDMPWLPLIHRSPPPPGSALREGQPEAAADTRHFQSPTPNDATVWSSRGGVVLMTLGAKLGALHTRVSGCWAELF